MVQIQLFQTIELLIFWIKNLDLNPLISPKENLSKKKQKM